MILKYNIVFDKINISYILIGKRGTKRLLEGEKLRLKRHSCKVECLLY